MKIILILTTTIFFLSSVSAQTIVVTDDNTYTTGQASSVLDVKSTSKGFLAPRMTAVQRAAIVSPAEGLLVYQTDGLKGFYFYSNTSWTLLSAAPWTLGGNAGTTSGTNFLGTTDNVSLKLKTANTQRMIID